MSEKIEIPITVECDCGKSLRVSYVSYPTPDVTIMVEPCPDCMHDKYEEGLSVGHDEGYEEGCCDKRYDEEREVGYEQEGGYDEGREAGYELGYEAGYENGQAARQ